MFLLVVCSEAVESKLVKLVTSHTVIISPTMIVLCLRVPSWCDLNYVLHTLCIFIYTIAKMTISLNGGCGVIESPPITNPSKTYFIRVWISAEDPPIPM